MITSQRDAAQKIAKSLRVRGLRDYMYHPRVVVTGWVLSQSTRTGEVTPCQWQCKVYESRAHTAIPLIASNRDQIGLWKFDKDCVSCFSQGLQSPGLPQENGRTRDFSPYHIAFLCRSLLLPREAEKRPEGL